MTVLSEIGDKTFFAAAVSFLLTSFYKFPFSSLLFIFSPQATSAHISLFIYLI